MIYQHRIRVLQLELTALNAEYDLQQSRFLDTLDLVDSQNAAIQNMKEQAIAREIALREALAKPPRVIYRDKIVEVPSIETGTCEEVIIDISKYVDGVMK